MRDAEPDVLAREWMRHLHDLGFTNIIRTGRLESSRKITLDWLARNCFEGYERVDFRGNNQELCAFKLAGVRRSAGCVIALEDNESLCREYAKLGDDAPVILQITDWRITATVLAELTGGCDGNSGR